MNNEPYCWLLNHELWFKEPKETDKEFEGYEITPLYTHPVKELTDEDLDKLIKDAEQGGYMEMYIVGLIDGFNRARAILRKTQKK